MKILYLYAELSPYLKPVFEAYVKIYGVKLHVVHWDHIKLTPYEPVLMDGVFYYKRSEYDLGKLKKLTEDLRPDLIYVVGWMDKDYLKVIIKWRLKGIPVVVGFDDVWFGNIRQNIGSMLMKSIGRYFFSHAFVSFARQYEFAKRMGFKDHEIISNLLSCDTELFQGSHKKLSLKCINYPHKFVYIGRFSGEKGIDLLAPAFKIYRDEYAGSWSLLCVGGGPLRSLLEGQDHIDVLDFVSQTEMISLLDSSGALIMPSYKDMCPLAVHEAASACLPLVLSSGVGNKSTFLIDGFNGYSFNSTSVHGLALAMHKIASLSDSALMEMSEHSYVLSKRVSPDMTAASLMSILLNN
ncbi:MAG: glycosyltransferase family 4 protein [Chlorobiaceae bacterium]|nr:glycosyltransferase family 4 protein [Chlorobiaceae bacterium]